MRVLPFSRRPDLEHPQGLVRVWFFDVQAAVVDEVTSPIITEEVARFLAERVESECQRRYVSLGRKVRYIHDWRGCQSYETKARDRLIAWGRVAHPHSELVTVCLSSTVSPFMRIAGVTGVGLLRMARVPIELVFDLDERIADLKEPAPGERAER